MTAMFWKAMSATTAVVDREDDMEVADRQQVGFTLGQPGARSGALAFGAMAIAAGNGRRPLAALWVDPVMGSWLTSISIFR